MTIRTWAKVILVPLTFGGLYCAYAAAYFAWRTALPQADIPRMQYDCYVYFFSGVTVGILWAADLAWLFYTRQKNTKAA
jgi:hypothetical protein